MSLKISLFSFLPTRLNNLSAQVFSRPASLPLSLIFLEVPKNGEPVPRGLSCADEDAGALWLLLLCRGAADSLPACDHPLLQIRFCRRNRFWAGCSPSASPDYSCRGGWPCPCPFCATSDFSALPSKSSRLFGNPVLTPVLALATSVCSPDLNPLFSPPGYYWN